jgi:hypothetical protein
LIAISEAKSAAKRENMFRNYHFRMLNKDMNKDILEAIKQYKEEGPTNLTWSEGDMWYGWTYNPEKKRFYFDDIGNESLMGLWEDQWAREAEDNQ